MTARVRVRIKLFKKLLPVYALFVIALSVIGIIFDMIAHASVGIIALFVSFLSLRYEYTGRLTYHSESTKRCIALSTALFVGSSVPLITFNIRVSLLFVVVVALFMTWLLYVIGIAVQRNKVGTFDLDHCTQEQLVARCKERFTRDVEYKTERAIKHFILKLPHEQIDVNPEQSKKERYRFRKILK